MPAPSPSMSMQNDPSAQSSRQLPKYSCTTHSSPGSDGFSTSGQQRMSSGKRSSSADHGTHLSPAAQSCIQMLHSPIRPSSPPTPSDPESLDAVSSAGGGSKICVVAPPVLLPPVLPSAGGASSSAGQPSPIAAARIQRVRASVTVPLRR